MLPGAMYLSEPHIPVITWPLLLSIANPKSAKTTRKSCVVDEIGCY